MRVGIPEQLNRGEPDYVNVMMGATYLEVVGCEGADNLWRDVQAWRTGQREAAVQIFATHRLLHQPVDQMDNQSGKQSFRWSTSRHS